MIHLSRSASRAAPLVGLAAILGVSLGAVGCTVTTEPASPVAYSQPGPPPPGMAPAPTPTPTPMPAPVARPVYIDPAFRQAVANYGQQVRAIHFAPEYQQQAAMGQALAHLADALERAPLTGRRTDVAADRIRRSASMVAYDSSARADSREVRAALDESVGVLSRLAQENFRGSRGVWRSLQELDQRVDYVRPGAPIRRQSDAIVSALDAAENVLNAMIVAADRGDVR